MPVYTYTILIILLTILFIYLILSLKKDHLIEKEILTSKAFNDLYENYNGFILCIESNMLLNEFYDYKNIYLLLNKFTECKIVTFNLSNKTYDENWMLLEKLKINSIPSIFYIQKNNFNKEIYSFTNGISKKDFMKIKDLIIENK